MSRARLSFCFAVAFGFAATSVLSAQEESAPGPAETAAPDVSNHPRSLKTKPSPKPVVPKAAAAQPIRQAQTSIPTLPSPVPAKQLPNGASSITESYGSWTVSCRLNDGQKLCTLGQIQGNKQTGQRTFGIELATPKGAKTDGTILMPFGIKLEAGATMKLDDKEFGQPLRYVTCVPDGCLLPVSFPAQSIEAMEKAAVLTVTSFNLGNGQAVTFSISLDGFPAALKRITNLGS